MMSVFSMYHRTVNGELADDNYAPKINMLKFDLSDPKQKRSAMFLAFLPMNADKTYINMLSALPIIPGLKQKKKRAEFVFDLITNLKSIENKNG